MAHYKAESRQTAPDEFRVELDQIDRNAPPALDNGHDCFDRGTNCYAARDDRFAEEFMGRWTMAGGRALPFRWTVPAGSNYVPHVIDHLPDWVKYADVWVSVDYGFTDPTAVGWWAVNHTDEVVLIDEIYETGLTPEDVGRMVQARNAENGWRPKHYLGDPRRPHVAHHMARLGMPIWGLNKNAQSDRKAGYLAVLDALSDDPLTGRPKLRIYRECKAFINEWKKLQRNPNARDEWSEGALKGADHAFDCARYFLVTRPRGGSQDPRMDAAMRRKFEFERKRRRNHTHEYKGGAVGVNPGAIHAA